MSAPRTILVAEDGPKINAERGKKLVCRCGGKIKLKRRSRDLIVSECVRCGREFDAIRRHVAEVPQESRSAAEGQ